MQPFHLSLKNYRCFSDAAPLEIDVRGGFTALVGPNNCGKSTVLKFFHEMYGLWPNLAASDRDHLKAVLNGSAYQFNRQDIRDEAEIANNANERDIEFRIWALIDGDDLASPHASVSLRGRRKSAMSNWELQILIDNTLEAVPAGSPTVDAQGNLTVAGQQYFWEPLRRVFQTLSRTMFVPAFRNAINEGSGTYYGMFVGSSFIAMWKQWKTGDNKANQIAIIRVTNDIKDVFQFESLEINASSDDKTLSIQIDGHPYRLAELGSGLAQFIVIFGNAAVKKPELILIDEPEINLHPALQQTFLTTLARYSGGNVMFATHSIGLARSAADAVYSFSRRRREPPRVAMLEKTKSYAEFAGEMSFSAYQEIGCDALLLVEGVSDIKTIQQFLRKLRLDSRVVVMHLGGDELVCGGRELELCELTRLTDRVYALVDSERDGPDAPPAQKRADFFASCKALNIRAHLTEYREIENYFTDSAVKLACGERHSALTPYESLKSRKNPWSKSHDNWRIAAEMSSEDVKATDIGEFLLKILEPSD